MVRQSTARAAENPHAVPGNHPPVRDIRDLLAFRVARFAAANDRVGQSWSFRRFGLRLNEWRVLGLVHAMQPVRLKQIASVLRMDKGQLSRIVKGLTDRDVLTSAPDPADQRTVHLRTTAHGASLHDDMLAVAIQRNEHLVASLDQREIAMLFDTLEKMTRDVEWRLVEAGETP